MLDYVYYLSISIIIIIIIINHIILYIITLYSSQADKSRGFAFVEFEEEADCKEALENMHGSELYGKYLKCSLAKPMSTKAPGTAIWAADDWIQNQMKEEEDYIDLENVEEANLNPE